MHSRRILYVDMDNVLVDFKSVIDRLEKDIVKKYEGKLDDVPGISVKKLQSVEISEQLQVLKAIEWTNAMESYSFPQ